MRIDFRQGILRHQTDTAGNPTFVQPNSGEVDLVVSPDQTLLTFADGDYNYLFEEQVSVPGAWSGPFVGGTDYWLYWDIDVVSGIRTFGTTTLEPIVSSKQPMSAAMGQMWFDKTENVMKEFTGRRFTRVLRVMAAKIPAGALNSIEPYEIGSQVGLWSKGKAGFILFDESDNAIVRQGSGYKRFLTTESPIATQFSGSAEFMLESQIVVGVAINNIPAWSAVCVKPDGIALASTTTPQFPAVGVINEDAVPGDTVNIIRAGSHSSSMFTFSNSKIGAPVFYDTTGQLTTLPPQTYSLQEVARVVSPNTITVDIKNLIRYQ